MGRKSSKAKEKKQKRLEERAAMDAVCAKVDAANRLGDPLEAFPVFKKYDRNGLNVSIECKRVSGLEPATVDWAFDLTKTNMQTMYEQSEWGWKDREKREEMTDDRAWYLIAWENSSIPVAFSHFRFDVECGDEVLYCYEVQLESKVRRKGLGKFLIQILQLMANSTQMKKVMLTVFKHNHGAYQFFREALQFEIDDLTFLFKKEVKVLPVLTPLFSAQIPLFLVSRGTTSGSLSSSPEEPFLPGIAESISSYSWC